MLHPHPHLPGAEGALVELDAVTAGYQRVPVLAGISLRIMAGDFVGLVGPSGSGKTTLLRTLLGEVRVVGGSVRIDGEAAVPGRTGIGYVPQLETVDWNFPVTAEEVVLLGCSPRRWLPWLPRHERAHAREVMARLGIADLRHRHIRQLSGGQQQRVFLARALVSEPKLLLLDEPTRGVDMKTRDEMLHLLDDLNHQGITILMTTHELNAVAAHLPWVVCLNGRLIAEGPPAEVFTPAILEETYGVALPVVEYQGMTLVAEQPHFVGRPRLPHQAGRLPGADVEVPATVSGNPDA
jgi:zinc/manganese transport system ATP-binding protein